MHLPEPNLLIPERFELLGGTNKKISEDQQRVLLSKPPHKLRDDEKWTIWHKLDRSFNQPKVYAILLLGEYPPPPHRLYPFSSSTVASLPTLTV